MRILTYLSFLCAALFSCTQEENVPTLITQQTNTGTISTMNELQVPDQFSWSASLPLDLTVEFQNIGETNFNLENELVLLLDMEGNQLTQALIKNNSVSFTGKLPHTLSKLQIYFPKTQNVLEVLPDEGDIFMEVATFSPSDILEIDNQYPFINGLKYLALDVEKNSNSNKRVQSTNLLQDGTLDGSLTVLPNDNWWPHFLLNEGGWYTSSRSNYQAIHGTESNNQFAEPLETHLLLGQTIDISAGGEYELSADIKHMHLYFHIMYYSGAETVGSSNVISQDQRTHANGSHHWKNKSFSFTPPQGATKATIYISGYDQGNGSAKIDNITLTGTVLDSDNDGVNDDIDIYPNDATKAFFERYPAEGYRSVLFEDLWPYQGDYDFNDVVVSTIVNTIKNADNNIVHLSISMDIDANGGDFNSDVMIRLLKADKTPFEQQIITSVGGANGYEPGTEEISSNLIKVISNNQKLGYKNNGDGANGDVQNKRFSIVIDPALEIKNIDPEIFICRTFDRSHEIHGDGYPVTSNFNSAMQNTGHDGGNFMTSEGYPWRLEIFSSTKFDHPKEGVSIINAYPQFANWVQNNKQSYTDWMETPLESKVFDMD
ncbi:LruC domain-containing protein [Sediminitomix flava]|uniref:LruC domain-containing protein n=1 Tax=Sediminitomix flava TaxID=379075 RepID=A0A316A388_SEDFL|nr:LruC domain-containing protein [Sediminitomix flava]PWJ44177.1 LruC domain-containing protein [Sediminitomix flava]